MEELQSFYMKADSDYDGIITWVGVYVCMGVHIYISILSLLFLECFLFPYHIIIIISFNYGCHGNPG